MEFKPKVIDGPLMGQAEEQSAPPEGTGACRNPWLDSSLDLKRGLDVIELSVDVLLPDLQESKPAS